MQRRPHHLGQGVRIPGARDQVHRRTQLGEGRVQLGRGVVGREGQRGGAGEHRVEQGRIVMGKSDERVGDSRQGVSAVGGTAARRRERVGELAESLHGDGGDDSVHAGEVFVQHRLAVLDLGGKPTGGDGVPALDFGDLACGVGNELASRGPVPSPTVFDGHGIMLAPI